MFYLCTSAVHCFLWAYFKKKKKYSEFERHGLNVKITGDSGILYQEINSGKASFA